MACSGYTSGAMMNPWAGDTGKAKRHFHSNVLFLEKAFRFLLWWA